MLLYSLLLFGIGIALLLKSSNLLVGNAAKLAKAFGTSEFVIGVGLIAVGTSLPEFVVASISSFTNNSGIALGNIIGANIANIALNLGIAASIATICIKRKIFDKECLMVFGSAVLLYVFSMDGIISRVDGMILLAIFGYYILFLLRRMKRLEDVFSLRSYMDLFFRNGKNAQPKANGTIETKVLALSVISLIGIVLGGYIFVNGAIGLANDFGLSSSIIGLTLVALSTSSPELAVSLQALKKKKPNLLLGNILGSNITNILLVLGFAALLNPLNVAKNLLDYGMPLMLIVTTILLMFAYVDLKISRREGLLLIGIYIAAIYFSFAGAITA